MKYKISLYTGRLTLIFGTLQTFCLSIRSVTYKMSTKKRGKGSKEILVEREMQWLITFYFAAFGDPLGKLCVMTVVLLKE